MKRIFITFDDGRIDNLTNAIPILIKYSACATFFICFGLTDKSKKSCDAGYNGDYLSLDDIQKIMSNQLFEIGSHSFIHSSDINDIMIGHKECLKFINKDIAGISLPNSKLIGSNIDDLIKKDNTIKYIRTGRNKNIMSLFSKICFFLYRKIIKSKKLFFISNKMNVDCINKESKLIYSIPVENGTRADDIVYLINKLPNNKESKVVLMFHSIDYTKNKWSYNVKEFEKLIQTLSKMSDVSFYKLENYND